MAAKGLHKTVRRSIATGEHGQKFAGRQERAACGRASVGAGAPGLRGSGLQPLLGDVGRRKGKVPVTLLQEMG